MKSPDYTRLGTLTEPRNFAPQTSGLSAAVMSEPPPKFDLSLATGVRKNDTVSTNAQTIVHTTYYPPGTDHDIGSTAIVPFADHRYVSPHSQIQNLRSDTLNHLTATESGLPALHNALDPQYFPFLEGARQAVATNHGVVKLKNVSFKVPGPGLLSNPACRFLSLRNDRKLLLSWDATLKFLMTPMSQFTSSWSE